MYELKPEIEYVDVDRTLYRKLGNDDPVYYDAVPGLKQVNTKTLGDFLKSLRDDLHVSDAVLDQRDNACLLIRKGYNLVPDWETVGGLKSKQFIQELLDAANENNTYKSRLQANQECDVPFKLDDDSFARVHLMYVENALTASIRIQPTDPPVMEAIFGKTYRTERTKRIIENLWEMFSQPQGLVIICGPVRSGKTHLEHAMYEDMNEPPMLHDGHILDRFRPHIYLVADPPEFSHINRYAVFHQREIGRNASSYEHVLHGALRFHHNIFALGEMRGEAEVAEAVLRASINGSLITTTAHTHSIVHAMRRFTTSTKNFEEDRMAELFKESIVGMVNLRLIPGTDGNEVLAVEYANFIGSQLKESLATPGTLKESLDTYKSSKKSQSLEGDIKWLISEGYVTKEAALRKCDAARLEQLLASENMVD